MVRPLNAVPQPALAALLTAADCSQASFARLTGVTARQVNAWCRGRAATPRWALILAAVLLQHSPDALAIALEEALQPPAPSACQAPGSGPQLPRHTAQ